MTATLDLSRRHRHDELMDRPDLPAEQHAAALDGLATLNWFSNSAGILAGPLFAVAREISPRPLRVLDIASGSGDVPLRLYQKALAAGLKIEVDGWDRSPVAVAHARTRAGLTGDHVRFHVREAFEPAPGERYDAVVSSLFLHHLEDEEAVALLKRMGDLADRLVIVNDLVRSGWGMWLARVATALFTRSTIVRADGPHSVEAAFTPLEVKELASRAGLHGAAVDRVWPARFRLVWKKS